MELGKAVLAVFEKFATQQNTAGTTPVMIDRTCPVSGCERNRPSAGRKGKVCKSTKYRGLCRGHLKERKILNAQINVIGKRLKVLNVNVI